MTLQGLPCSGEANHCRVECSLPGLAPRGLSCPNLAVPGEAIHGRWDTDPLVFQALRIPVVREGVQASHRRREYNILGLDSMAQLVLGSQSWKRGHNLLGLHSRAWSVLVRSGM